MKLIISWEAAADLDRLCSFLEKGNPEAASRAAATIESAIQSLDTMPERGRPSKLRNTRELLVPFGKSAYLVRYTYWIENDGNRRASHLAWTEKLGLNPFVAFPRQGKIRVRQSGPIGARSAQTRKIIDPLLTATKSGAQASQMSPSLNRRTLANSSAVRRVFARGGFACQVLFYESRQPTSPYSAATALTSIRNSSRTSRSMISSVFGG
jgi:plasmid stabilization system protein ParE